MKRLLVAALVLSMLGSSAVVAAPYNRGNYGYTHGNNNGAVLAGLGIFALAAILASQNNHHYDQYNRGYGRYDNDRGGYDQYRNGYQSEYGNRGHW